MRKIEPKTIYRHFKGKHYLIEDIAQDSETLEFMVVYRGLYDDCRLWVRKLGDFLSEVNVAGQIYRFEKVDSID